MYRMVTILASHVDDASSLRCAGNRNPWWKAELRELEPVASICSTGALWTKAMLEPPAVLLHRIL
jgi:hypothetical protein